MAVSSTWVETPRVLKAARTLAQAVLDKQYVLPERIHHWWTTTAMGPCGYYPFLMLLAQIVRPRMVVELGTWSGMATVCLAEGAGPTARIVTYDRETATGNGLCILYPGITQRAGCSWEAGEQWTDGPVDFLFIDAEHTYEALTKDLAAWRPHLVPQAPICVDDVAQPGMRDALRDAGLVWEEFPWLHAGPSQVSEGRMWGGTGFAVAVIP